MLRSGHQAGQVRIILSLKSSPLRRHYLKLVSTGFFLLPPFPLHLFSLSFAKCTMAHDPLRN